MSTIRTSVDFVPGTIVTKEWLDFADSKINETVSVTDYGATGDGSTDDTAAVQAALSSGASDIYFPTCSSAYMVDQLTVPSTVKRLYGSGLIKQRTAGTTSNGTAGNVFSVTSHTAGLHINGLRIRGAWTFGTTNDVGEDNRAFLFTSCSDVRVTGCHFTLLKGNTVHFMDCDRAVCSDNVFYRCGRAVYVRGGLNISIADNVINETIYDSSIFTVAVSVESTDGHAYGTPKRITITGNTITEFANAQGIHVHSGERISIVGNNVQDSAIPISVNPFNADDIIEGVTIVGNTVTCVQSGISGYSGGNDGILVQAGGSTPDVVDVTIVGNVVLNANRLEDGANQGGIRIGYTKRVTIIGNTITSAKRNGIVLTDAEEDVVVSGNIISSVIVGGSTQNGILVLAAARGIIADNIFSTLNDASGVGVKFSVASDLQLRNNQYNTVTLPVSGAGHAQARKTLAVTSGTSVDLQGVEVVAFAHGSGATVSTWTGVEVGKVYLFTFANGNTTLAASGNKFAGGSDITPTTDDVVLMMGLSSTTLKQVSAVSANA